MPRIISARARGRSTAFAMAALAALAWMIGLQAQEASMPAPASTAGAKDLTAAMTAKNLQAFTAEDPDHVGHFAAALLVPGVQLLVVSADYDRPTDIQYRIYTKDFMNGYMDLNSSVLSKNKVFIEDAKGDGLVPVPAKDAAADSATIGGDHTVFDGDFTKPGKKSKDKISYDDYVKAFTAADADYTKALALLLDAIRKTSPPVGAGAGLR
jgi:hypothetical protein